ncbi:Atrophin-1 domain containing protein [Pyrenophora tritici-repentis]|uniref:Atrophin-1 domain containing protein n=1 Tax=Pyrenophora tritici-repentis TaxID=45151 RepID=A0A316ZKB5_9PLEO|nr:Atrophin-1 domain containing protein [Pyrenophora tritici-repentis]
MPSDPQKLPSKWPPPICAKGASKSAVPTAPPSTGAPAVAEARAASPQGLHPLPPTMGENGATLAALEQPAVALPLSEHNSKALSPERVGFIQHTLHSVPRMAFKKPTPRPKLQRPPTCTIALWQAIVAAGAPVAQAPNTSLSTRTQRPVSMALLKLPWVCKPPAGNELFRSPRSV